MLQGDTISINITQFVKEVPEIERGFYIYVERYVSGYFVHLYLNQQSSKLKKKIVMISKNKDLHKILTCRLVLFEKNNKMR